MHCFITEVAPDRTSGRFGDVAATVERSFARLGVAHIDVYCLHYPAATDAENWAAYAILEEFVLAGRIRNSRNPVPYRRTEA